MADDLSQALNLVNKAVELDKGGVFQEAIDFYGQAVQKLEFAITSTLHNFSPLKLSC
jgi:hypothetical protein